MDLQFDTRSVNFDAGFKTMAFKLAFSVSIRIRSSLLPLTIVWRKAKITSSGEFVSDTISGLEGSFLTSSLAVLFAVWKKISLH